MTARTVFLLPALLLAGAAHGGVYKCTVDGKIVFQPAPCVEGGGEVSLQQPSAEVIERQREDQRRINGNIAERDRLAAERQKKIDEQNFWRKLEADRIAADQRYNRRMQEINDEYQANTRPYRCAGTANDSDECRDYRWDVRMGR